MELRTSIQLPEMIFQTADHDVAGKPTAPCTYQDWINQFTYIRNNPMTRIPFRDLRTGSLAVTNMQVLDSFLTRMDDMIKEVMNFRIRQFLSELECAFEEYDFEGAEFLALRFINGISDCFFFQELSFIPLKQRQELAEGYESQFKTFWKGFVQELQKDADETNNLEVDELAYKLKRLHIHIKGGNTP